MDSNPSILIIGAGRVGTNLARLAAARHQAVTLWNPVPVPPAIHAALATTKPVTLAIAGEPEGTFELVLVAVADQHVLEAARAAVQWASTADAQWAHTSGSLGCLSLPSGQTLGVCHPAFAFPAPDLPLYRLQKAAFLVDGTVDQRKAFVRLIDHWGGTAVDGPGTDPLLYHAGCVTASNFLALIGSQAAQLFAAARIPTSGQELLLLSLMESVLEHARVNGFGAAMTGPAARGDASTITAEATRIAQETPAIFNLFVEGNMALLAEHGHEAATEMLLQWLDDLSEE